MICVKNFNFNNFMKKKKIKIDKIYKLMIYKNKSFNKINKFSSYPLRIKKTLYNKIYIQKEIKI